MTYYEKAGPKAVILFHAYTSTALDVLSLGRALARENYTVYMPTLSGHDLDDPDQILNYGIEDWKKDGEDAYQKLVDDGYENISVFGLSLGGVIATYLALNKEVKSYGAFSSPLMPDQETNIVPYFLSWYQGKKKDAGFDRDLIKEKVVKIMIDLNEEVKEMAQSYEEIQLPVFLGQGGLDQMIDPKETKKLAQRFKKAEVDFHCYEEAPHVITTGRAGQALRKDLIAFLDRYA